MEAEKDRLDAPTWLNLLLFFRLTAARSSGVRRSSGLSRTSSRLSCYCQCSADELSLVANDGQQGMRKRTMAVKQSV